MLSMATELFAKDVPLSPDGRKDVEGTDQGHNFGRCLFSCTG